MSIIRKENPKDIKSIYALNQSAFEGDSEAKIVDALRKVDELTLSLVVQVNADIIGHIAFSEVKITSKTNIDRAIGLGPMAVLPQYQRQGYGTQLVQKGLKILTEQGHGAVVVLGHPDFYPKFGFVPAVEYGICCEYECPPEAFMVKALKPDALKGLSGTVYYSSIFSQG